MHKERLQKLVDFAKTWSPERFDFRHFVGNDWKGDPNLSCGTTACMLGLATQIPEFAALGLKLVDFSEVSTARQGGVTLRTPEEVWFKNFAEASEEAGKEFFGLTEREYCYLFIPIGGGDDGSVLSRAVSLVEALEHFQEFIDTNGASAAGKEEE